MIGASLDQLDSLASTLGQTSGDIIDVNADAQRASSDAVAQMNDIAEATRAAIEAAMADMVAAVGRSRSELGGADWTGPNRLIFDNHYTNFDTAMTTAQANTNETFMGLKTTITQMGEQIEAYAAEIRVALDAASQSATSMSTAVTTQRANLESAMSGMAVG
ncbi:MAG: hypothetical protein ACN4GZ_10490 [Acidimicrobiales bacterium]